MRCAWARRSLARSHEVMDTTVQEKNVAHPTDAKLAYRAQERLVKLAKKHGLKLRQSHVRVGKKALIKQQRYAHAKQFRRARRELRKLKTWLGRVNRDIERQIAGDTALQDIFRRELWQAERVRTQKPRDARGGMCMRCTRRRWNASARARATRRRDHSLHHGWQWCRGWCSWATRCTLFACTAGAVRGESLRGHHHQALTGWPVRGACGAMTMAGAARQAP